MSNPPGPDQEPGQDPDRNAAPADAPADHAGAPTEPVGRQVDAETEILAVSDPDAPATTPSIPVGERRFTAPSGMDAGETQVIGRTAEPETEIFGAVEPTGSSAPDAAEDAPKVAVPQEIPARPGAAKPVRRRSWGWVLALILVIAALAAVAILGTLLLTRTVGSGPSDEDRVRQTIESYDTAIEKGDLATLRGITCGTTAEEYNKLDDRKWTETHRRVADAGQYPVIASIDQVVINGEHAEANVTTFMASDPATRSTRSLDLQFRDDQWKICQNGG